MDRGRAETALGEHYRRLGIAAPPVRWVNDAEQGYLAAFRAARSAARRAAWRAADAAWSASAARSAAIDRWIGIWLPFVDAYEAGLWLFWPTATEVIAVGRPTIQLEGERLHCATGPAVAWPDGARYYFWRGVQVPERVILAPETLTGQEILTERNAEVRRVMIERQGYERFLAEVNARPVHQDTTGALYRIEVPDDEPVCLVHVINATPEPDGTRKRYVLRVPPTMQRARQAVAWTFGCAERTYHPAVES